MDLCDTFLASTVVIAFVEVIIMSMCENAILINHQQIYTSICNDFIGKLTLN